MFLRGLKSKRKDAAMLSKFKKMLLILGTLVIAAEGDNNMKKDIQERIERFREQANIQVVNMETSAGDILLILFPDTAPLTVRSFLANVDGGLYNGTIFPSIYKTMGIVGGAYTAERRANLASSLVTEEQSLTLKNKRGSIAALKPVRADAKTAPLFMINIADNNEVSAQCSFGMVVEGMDIADKIAAAPTDAEGKPLEKITIFSMSKGDFYPKK
jgi:cyclophilin family peptidyl-prolyl cis-trans isomerase